MFLFFGISPKTKRYGFVRLQCEVHGGLAQHELSSYRSWFKLFFFLSLFPVGRERHILTCSECGTQYEVSPQEAQQLAAQAQDIDIPMTDTGFGGGMLGQVFGGGMRGQSDGRFEQPYPNEQRYPSEQRYPNDQSQGAAHPSGADDEVYRTTPRPAPDQPMRVRSRRLDGSE